MNDTPKVNIILLAEDDSDDRLLLKDAMSECHWDADLRQVENGEELLDYLLHRGKFDQPRGSFTFIEEDLKGTQPKFVVRDVDGVKWTVKLGSEARPETAASRLIWAAGYFANEDYFLPLLTVQSLPARLHRGQNFVAPDGTLRAGNDLRRSQRRGVRGPPRRDEHPAPGTDAAQRPGVCRGRPRFGTADGGEARLGPMRMPAEKL